LAGVGEEVEDLEAVDLAGGAGCWVVEYLMAGGRKSIASAVT